MWWQLSFTVALSRGSSPINTMAQQKAAYLLLPADCKTSGSGTICTGGVCDVLNGSVDDGGSCVENAGKAPLDLVYSSSSVSKSVCEQFERSGFDEPNWVPQLQAVYASMIGLTQHITSVAA